MKSLSIILLSAIIALTPTLSEAHGGFRGGGGGWHGGGGRGWGGGWGGRGYYGGYRGYGYRGGYYGGGWGAAPWVGLGLGILGGVAAYNAYRSAPCYYRIVGYDAYGNPISQPCY